MVHSLVVRRAATVLVTLRSGEHAPDAVTALWKDEHLPRLELQALSVAESGTLLSRVLDAPLDSAGVDRLWSLSQGNSLYLRHLVDGVLADPDGSARWRGSGSGPRLRRSAPSWPRSCAARWVQLPDEVLDVVDLLAVGEPVPLDAMSALTAPAALEQAALPAGLVRTVTVPRALTLRLAASALRRSAAVRDRAGSGPPPARSGGDRTVHGGVTRQGAAMRSAPPWTPTRGRTPGACIVAAHQAVGLFDLTLGERLARAAAESGGGVDARLAQAFALSWLSRGEEAEEILAGLAEEGDAAPVLPLVTGGRVGNLFFWTLGRTDEAERLLAATLAGVDGPFDAFFTALRVAFDASLGRVRRAYDDGLALLDDPDLPAIAVLMAALGVAASGAVLGQVEVVKHAAVRGYDAAAKSAEGGIPRLAWPTGTSSR